MFLIPKPEFRGFGGWGFPCWRTKFWGDFGWGRYNWSIGLLITHHVGAVAVLMFDRVRLEIAPPNPTRQNDMGNQNHKMKPINIKTLRVQSCDKCCNFHPQQGNFFTIWKKLSYQKPETWNYIIHKTSNHEPNLHLWCHLHEMEIPNIWKTQMWPALVVQVEIMDLVWNYHKHNKPENLTFFVICTEIDGLGFLRFFEVAKTKTIEVTMSL